MSDRRNYQYYDFLNFEYFRCLNLQKVQLLIFDSLKHRILKSSDCLTLDREFHQDSSLIYAASKLGYSIIQNTNFAERILEKRYILSFLNKLK